MTYAMSETHAKTLPERMVPIHEENAKATRIGPMITMMIPRRKISERIGQRLDLDRDYEAGPSLRLCNRTKGRVERLANVQSFVKTN